MSKLTDCDAIAAHRRYYHGREKMAAVAAVYGVHPTTLHYAFVRLGLPKRPHRETRAPLDDGQLAEARQRLDSREPLDDIAATFAVCDRTLRRRLIEAGYSARKGQR